MFGEGHFRLRLSGMGRGSLSFDPLLASTFLGDLGQSYINSIKVDSENNIYVLARGLGKNINIYKFNSDLTILLFSNGFGSTDYKDRAVFFTFDRKNNIYVIGNTQSEEFPITDNAYDRSFNRSTHCGTYCYDDVFITKMDSNLTTILASTYLGGLGSDSVGGMYAYQKDTLVFDNENNVYITGRTYLNFLDDTPFPTTENAYDRTVRMGSSDVFISKLDSNLSTLLASTYLGSDVHDVGLSIALDSTNNIYVAGETGSRDFPTTEGAYDRDYNNGNGWFETDVFVAKLNNNLSSLLGSTFLGGADNETVSSIALDSTNNVYITGETESSNFPFTPGAYDTTFGGESDVFVSKFNNSLTNLLASTFLGDSDWDCYPSSILDSANNNIYITGMTYSQEFLITPGAYDTTFNTSGYGDVFVAKINTNLDSLLASTFLGGEEDDLSTSIALNSLNNVYILGETYSSDFPITSGAYDVTFNKFPESFISKLDPNLSAPLPPTQTIISCQQLAKGEEGPGEEAYRGYVKISYKAIDFNYDNCNLPESGRGYKYSADQTPDTWHNNATLKPEEGLSDIPASPDPGIENVLYWDCRTDLPDTYDNQVWFRLSLNDGTYQAATPTESLLPFSVDTKAPEITNLTAQHSGEVVTVNYTVTDDSLTDDPARNVEVTLFISDDSGDNWEVSTASADGDIGLVKTSGEKIINWYPKVDYIIDGQYKGTMQARVQVEDIYGNSFFKDSDDFILDMKEDNKEDKEKKEGLPYFKLLTTTPQVAGVPFELTIKAINGEGEIDISYSKKANLTLNYLSPGTGNLTLSKMSIDTFVNGATTTGLTYGDCGTISITAIEDGDQSMKGTSETITFYPHHFVVGTDSSIYIVNDTFQLIASARNADGDVTSNYKGEAGLSIGEYLSPLTGGFISLSHISSNQWMEGIARLSLGYNKWGRVTIKVFDEVRNSSDGLSSPIMFNPKTFSLTPSTPPRNRKFFYLNESFQIKVTALDANEKVINNYHGSISLKGKGLDISENNYIYNSDEGSYTFINIKGNSGSDFTTKVTATDSDYPDISGQSPIINFKFGKIKVYSQNAPLNKTVSIRVEILDKDGQVITEDESTSFSIKLDQQGGKDNSSLTCSLGENENVIIPNGKASFELTDTEGETVNVIPSTNPGLDSEPGSIIFEEILTKSPDSFKIIDWHELKKINE
ncbi:MAG: SBBP repeat-containing protein [bacterium]